MAEIAQVGADVQRETVHGDAARDANSDRCDLSVSGPDPGVTRLGPGLDAQVRQRRHEHFFDPAHVAHHVEPGREPRYGTYRIAHQLAGAVVGDVPTAVHVVQLGADAREHAGVDDHVGAVTVASDRVCVRVLDQQLVVVVGPPDDPALPDGALQVPCFEVGKASQPANP